MQEKEEALFVGFIL